MLKVSRGFMRAWIAVMGIMVGAAIFTHPAPGGHDVAAERAAVEYATDEPRAVRGAQASRGVAAPREAAAAIRDDAAPVRSEFGGGRRGAPSRAQDALAGRSVPAPDLDDPPEPDPSPPVEAAVSDNLDLDAITARIRDDLVPLAVECHLLTRAGDPTPTGMLVLEFDVLGDEGSGGIVDDVRAGEQSTIVDPAFVECLSESMMTVRLDPPTDGEKGHAIFPLVFALG